MGRIVVFNSITLDGVLQGPAHPDEDRRGGFDRGGWAAPYADEITMGLASEGSDLPSAGLLFGRHTYEQFYGVWAGRRDNPFSEILDNTPKYVVSRTHEGPLPWQNSVLLRGDAAETVRPLHDEAQGEFTILGSGELIRSLLRADLIDRMVLLIHPLVLGAGRRLFDDESEIRTFRLTRSQPNTKGVLITTYERERT